MDELKEIRTILVVEDEPGIREMIDLLLRPLHHGLEFAANGEEALALIDEGRAFSLIVSDIQMPKMNGIRFFEEVRARGLSTPFVFLTAYGDKAYLTQALKLGAFDYLEKPFSALRLIEVVNVGAEMGAGFIEDMRTLNLPVTEGGELETSARSLMRNLQFRNFVRAKNQKQGR